MAERKRLTFGAHVVCRYCRGTGRLRGQTCQACAGKGVELTEAQRLAIGEQRRDDAFDGVMETAGQWSARAMDWIRQMRPGARFTSDALTAAIGYPPARAAVGPVIALASRRRLIRSVGVRQSTNPTSNASIIQLWERQQ